MLKRVSGNAVRTRPILLFTLVCGSSKQVIAERHANTPLTNFAGSARKWASIKFNPTIRYEAWFGNASSKCAHHWDAAVKLKLTRAVDDEAIIFIIANLFKQPVNIIHHKGWNSMHQNLVRSSVVSTPVGERRLKVHHTADLLLRGPSSPNEPHASSQCNARAYGHSQCSKFWVQVVVLSS